MRRIEYWRAHCLAIQVVGEDLTAFCQVADPVGRVWDYQVVGTGPVDAAGAAVLFLLRGPSRLHVTWQRSPQAMQEPFLLNEGESILLAADVDV